MSDWAVWVVAGLLAIWGLECLAIMRTLSRPTPRPPQMERRPAQRERILS